MAAEDDDDLNRAYEYSQELYQVIYQKKDKILAFDPNDANADQESEIVDLIIATEIISYSVMSIGLQPNQIDNQQQELSNSVEKLVAKMNDLTLSNKFLEQNKIVSKFVTSRGDGGLIMSMQELICQSIDNH